MQEEATTSFTIEVQLTFNDMHKWRLADNTKDIFIYNFDRNLNIDTLGITEICFILQLNLS